MTSTPRSTFAALPVVAVLLACNVPPPLPRPPVAKPGDPKTVQVGVLVQLDGSKSEDPLGKVLSFEWNFVALPADSRATLNSPTVMNPTFVADRPGAYDLRLVVRNAEAASDPATARITATAKAPLAVVLDDIARPGSVVTLDGSGSKSFAGTPLTFTWKVIDPLGAAVTLSNAATATPSFRADPVGAYPVELMVNDGTQDSATAKAKITVSNDLARPVARITADLDARIGRATTLDGSDSTTTNLDATFNPLPLSYAWTLAVKPAGSTASLQDAATSMASVTPDLVGTYLVKLVVRDALASSEPAPATLTAIDDNQAPVARPGPDLAVPVGRVATLQGGASYDPDGNTPLTYAWTLVARPTGSSSALTGAGTDTAGIAPDQPGRYTVQLVVTDAKSKSSAPATVHVDAANGAPTASVLGARLAGFVNTVLALDGSGSTDPDGDPLVHVWTIVGTPSGAAAVLSSRTGASVDFGGSLAGSYLVLLEVFDPQGNRGSVTASITLSRASQLALVGGDSQTGTVGANLAQDLLVRATTATGTAVPNANLVWRIHGGRLIAAAATTDASGEAKAIVELTRIAGAGAAQVWLADDPAAKVTFGFTAQPGTGTSIAVSAQPGNADSGPRVFVRVVDKYGNLVANEAANNTAQFRLAASSGSGNARFAAAALRGTILGGGGSATIDGQLVAGELEIVLNDTTAELVNLTLDTSALAASPLPFSAWRTSLFDNAEQGFGFGWTVSGAGAPWRVTTATAGSGSRSFGVEMSPANASQLLSSVALRNSGAPATSAAVRLNFAHNIKTATAPDAQAKCTAGPVFFATMRSCGSPFCGEWNVTPVGGYPVVDSCDNRESFGSASGSGWVKATFDITDAVAKGFPFVAAHAANSPRSATPAQASAWYVDDVEVTHLTAAGPVASTFAFVFPGSATRVQFTAPNFGAPAVVLYGVCRGDKPPVVPTATILDANGNRTQDSTLVFQMSWTGGAALLGAGSGEIVNLAASSAEVRFENGSGGIVLDSGSTLITAVTLTDSRTTGLAVGPSTTGTIVRTAATRTAWGPGSRRTR